MQIAKDILQRNSPQALPDTGQIYSITRIEPNFSMASPKAGANPLNTLARSESHSSQSVVQDSFAWGEGSAPSLPSPDDEQDYSGELESAVGGLSAMFVPHKRLIMAEKVAYFDKVFNGIGDTKYL
jgi:hypothetical protein